MLRNAAITGWGHYVPAKILSNQALEALVETSDSWIFARTGIRERRIAAPHETTSSMCTLAASDALARAHLAADELDLVICATTTPDHLLPATACLVQGQLRAGNAGAFDVNAGCTGFLTAFLVGAQFIRSGTCSRVLVVAGETLSRFVNWTDRNTCVLFGDGAGAVVLEATEQDCGVRSSVLACRGDTERLLSIEAGGSAKPASQQTVEQDEHCLAMHGNEVFRLAVRAMSLSGREALLRADLAVEDVRAVIAHQANARILRATQEALGLPVEKLFLNVEKYGNTGCASAAIALSEFLTAETLLPGEHLLLTAFGGGFNWASVVFRQAAIASIIRERIRGVSRLAA